MVVVEQDTVSVEGNDWFHRKIMLTSILLSIKRTRRRAGLLQDMSAAAKSANEAFINQILTAIFEEFRANPGRLSIWPAANRHVTQQRLSSDVRQHTSSMKPNEHEESSRPAG